MLKKLLFIPVILLSISISFALEKVSIYEDFSVTGDIEATGTITGNYGSKITDGTSELTFDKYTLTNTFISGSVLSMLDSDAGIVGLQSLLLYCKTIGEQPYLAFGSVDGDNILFNYYNPVTNKYWTSVINASSENIPLERYTVEADIFEVIGDIYSTNDAIIKNKITSGDGTYAFLSKTMKDLTADVGLENAARSIDTDGRFLYLGTYYDNAVCPLQIYDIHTDPANPTKVSPVSIEGIPAHPIKGIKYWAGYLYISLEASGGDAFRIVDVSGNTDPTASPDNPIVVGGSGLTDLPAMGAGTTLDIEGNTAFMTSVDRVYAIDVTDKTAPSIISYITPIIDANLALWTCKVLDGYVYIGGRNSTTPTNHFRIIDARTPATMSVVGGSTLSLPDGMWTLNVENIEDKTYVFIAAGKSFFESDNPKFYIIDATDKTNPTIVSSLLSDITSPSSYIKYVNDYCYLVNWGTGTGNNLYVINVKDKANPFVISTQTYANAPLTLAVNGKYLYLGFAPFDRPGTNYLGYIEEVGLQAATGVFHDLSVGFWGEKVDYTYNVIRNGDYSQTRIPMMRGYQKTYDEGIGLGQVEEGVYFNKALNIIQNVEDSEDNPKLVLTDYLLSNKAELSYDLTSSVGVFNKDLKLYDGLSYKDLTLGKFTAHTDANTSISAEKLDIDLTFLLPDLNITIPILNGVSYSSNPEAIPLPYAIGIYDNLILIDKSSNNNPQIMFSSLDFVSNNAVIGANFNDGYLYTNWDWCPNEDYQYDLGKSTLRWKDGYFSENIYAQAIGINGITPRAAIDLSTGTIVGTGLQLPHIINKKASDNVRNSHDAETTSISDSYVKVKTITLTNGLLGQQRFTFDIKTSDETKTAYGRIYRNGAALGTEQTTISTSYVTKSEDITQNWNPGDKCELWMHNDGVGTTSVKNFRINYDDNPSVKVDSNNS